MAAATIGLAVRTRAITTTMIDATILAIDTAIIRGGAIITTITTNGVQH